MKQKTNRLHFSTRTLAMVLSIVMLIGSIATGSMLNTFAAYLKEAAANSDAVSQAASEGSDIAKSAIPSDGAAAQADNNEDKPDLSGFAENEIVRGMKNDFASVGANADLAETGDTTTYYMHIGVQSAFRTGDGIAFTYDAAKGLYYASYELVKNEEYPMVINTTSVALGEGDKSSSNQSVTTKNSSFNPNSIQFDYFSYNTNNFDAYDCFKFKTQTTQTVYFTFTTPSAGLVVRSSLEGVTPETPTESSKVYFAKPAGWTNAYVYFYSQEYWDEDKGTGSNTNNGCLNGSGTEMSADDEYPEYYSASLEEDTSYVVFADKSQPGYGNFYGDSIKVALKMNDGTRTGTQVAFNKTTPVYTPDTSTSQGLNPSPNDPHATYYLSGTWSALPEEYHNVTFSQPTGGTITVNGEDHSPISVNRRGTFTVNVTPDHGFVFKSLSVGGEDVTASVSEGSYTGTMGTADIAVVATFEYAGKVTDADLKAVLAGTKVMIYGSENTGWQTYSPFYVMRTNSTGDAETQGDVNNSPTYSFGGTNNFGVTDPLYVTVRAADYYFGHWNSNLNTSISVNDAGKVYVVYGTLTTGTTVVEKDTQDSDILYAISGGTTTVTTTFPGTVYQGYTAPVATGAPGTSVLGLTNTIEYYVKDGENYYEVEATNGYIDTSAFAVKDGYKLITVLKDDNNLRVVAATNDFNVVAPDLKTINIKSNNARLGTGTSDVPSTVPGQIVTITIHANMGSFASIGVKDASDNDVPTTEVTPGTTYTFVMPSTNATVNLTFNDYTATSPFYYNSYETNGSPSGTRYGQRMTEGEINGEKFSYYHVEGRTGSDHLFTVSYGSPVYNSYDAFFDINKDWEQNKGVKAQFYATDGNNLGDYANMTYVKEENSKKKFKIAIPDGARTVRFKHGNNTTGQLNLYEGNNGWYTGDTFDSVTGYNNGYNPVPVNFYENFNGEGKYTANFKTKGFNDHNATRGESHAYTKPKDLGTDSGDYYIVVLYSGKTYTINGEEHTVAKDPEIIWMPKLPGTEDIDSSEVNVYGKDGPIVIDWNNKASSGASDTTGTAYGYGVIADTKLYDSDGTTSIGTAHTDDGNDYESAKVVVTSEDSANIVVKTTIASDYRSKYYLKGWNINGVTYACGNNVKGVNDENAGSDGEYTMTYTIPAGTEDSAKIEITPIYYLTSSYKTTNEIETVTFFLEGYSTITEKWGDTPYIYPFYGNLNNIDNSFGVYPGQPMVFASGQYSVEVPVNKNVPIAKDPGSNAVKGITINNGYADHVHRNLVYKWSDHDNDQEHKQTYDYDDFYKIYEECLKNGTEHPNSIIFRIHDEETVFNRSQYGGGKSGQFASGTNGIDIDTIATSGNGWELLTNRYGQAINLFGAHVTDPTTETATTDTSNALYVVSTGYNANIAGDYGTMWKVYDGSGQLISNGGGRYGIPPSVLLLRGSSSGYSTTITYPSADRSVEGVGSYKDSIGDYETIYKALHSSSYTGKRVYITYEKDAQDTRKVTSGTGANRLDGRWYYTHSSDKVKSTIGIEYWDNSQNKWVTDTMSGITGSHTNCTAKFTDNNTTTSNEYLISSGGTYNFTATTYTGWKFDSWQIKYSDTSYDPIDTTLTASMPATASYEIVARFVPIDSGSLTINHTLNKASTGEGTVDMAVNVYTDSTLTTKVSEFTEKSGTRVYLDDTYINNNNSYYVKIELKTTPKYDGKVSEFTYDKFNSDNNIIATDTSPGSENTLTTSTFSFPVSALYNVGTQKTKVLNYTSLIDETLHYYNFVYNLTTRGNVSKTYTSKGVLNKTDYKKVVSDQTTHTLDNSILVDKAPFESNFLMSNTLSKGEISYISGTHTYTATSTFEQSGAVPKYHVVFKLPYEYLDEGDSTATPKTKKYTVTSDKTYNADKATFDLLAEYNTFVTVNATSSAIGTQENVNKVTDSSDINHAGNNFITAPEELNGSGTTKYFQYWDIKKLKSDGTAGDDVAKIYYPDFHYRVYNNYYVEAVYSDDAADSWKHNYSEEDNTAVDCSVLYLGDSRNQWNDGTKADGYTTNSSTEAADMIYNDFIFHYTYKGQELKNVSGVEVGMILERATYLDTSDSNKQKWLTGSTSVNDMSYYRANYGGTGTNSTESTRKNAILAALTNDTALPSGTIKQQWQNSVLNNKNFTEQSYSVYSQYGQTVANDTITFAKDNTIDNYVYRAYAYIKDSNGYTLSDPVYFSMRYTSNLKYTE